jgi:hypothetical protein
VIRLVIPTALVRRIKLEFDADGNVAWGPLKKDFGT